MCVFVFCIVHQVKVTFLWTICISFKIAFSFLHHFQWFIGLNNLTSLAVNSNVNKYWQLSPTVYKIPLYLFWTHFTSTHRKVLILVGTKHQILVFYFFVLFGHMYTIFFVCLPVGKIGSRQCFWPCSPNLLCNIRQEFMSNLIFWCQSVLFGSIDRHSGTFKFRNKSSVDTLSRPVKDQSGKTTKMGNKEQKKEKKNPQLIGLWKM